MSSSSSEICLQSMAARRDRTRLLLVLTTQPVDPNGTAEAGASKEEEDGDDTTTSAVTPAPTTSSTTSTTSLTSSTTTSTTTTPSTTPSTTSTTTLATTRPPPSPYLFTTLCWRRKRWGARARSLFTALRWRRRKNGAQDSLGDVENELREVHAMSKWMPRKK